MKNLFIFVFLSLLINCSTLESTVCNQNDLPKKNLVCFYRGDSQHLQGQWPELDACLCSHLIYDYVVVRENLAFVAGRKGDLKNIAKLKEKNPSLKILVSLRPNNGLSFLKHFNTIEFANDEIFSFQKKFARRTRDFLIKHNLDGVDVNWPTFLSTNNLIENSIIDQKEKKRKNLLHLVKSLYDVFAIPSNRSENFLISLTVDNKVNNLNSNYGFNEIESYLSFINLPAFDFPLTINQQDEKGNLEIIDFDHIQHPSQLHSTQGAQNLDTLVDLLILLGVNENKINVGIAAHGLVGKKVNDKIIEQSIERSDICQIIQFNNNNTGEGWVLTREADGTAPALIRDNVEWIGFDDEISAKLKAKYAFSRQLAGVAFWNIEEDDSSGTKCERSFSLIRSILSGLNHNKVLAHDDFIERYGNVEKIINDKNHEKEDESLVCSNNSSYHVNPKDCTIFYRCLLIDNKYVRSKFKCGIGLVFDEELGICTYPSWLNNKYCLGSGEVKEKEDDDKEIKIGSDSLYCNNKKLKNFYQKKDDCEYFYYCNEKMNAYQFKCPFELGFDEKRLQCNWKWLVSGCNVAAPNLTNSNSTSDNNMKDLFKLMNHDNNTRKRRSIFSNLPNQPAFLKNKVTNNVDRRKRARNARLSDRRSTNKRPIQESFLTSDLFKDYSIDIRPIHLKLNNRLSLMKNLRKNLLIIPVPDDHPKAQSLEELLDLQFGNNLEKLNFNDSNIDITTTRKPQKKSSKKHKNQSKQQPKTLQNKKKKKNENEKSYPKTMSSKAPVVIKLEVPNGEIVERIFDKVKNDLIHTTTSTSDRPVYISLTTTAIKKNDGFTTESSFNITDDIVDTSKVYLLGKQQIPQHVFETLKQTNYYNNVNNSKMKSNSAPKNNLLKANNILKSSSNLKNSRPTWKKNWPPNISYTSLTKNSSLLNNHSNDLRSATSSQSVQHVGTSVNTISSDSKAETLIESLKNLPLVIQEYQEDRKLRRKKGENLMPETSCLREGLFQHPLDCNKFYECKYNTSLKKYVADLFECNIKVAFDDRIIGCGLPTDPTVCIHF